MICVIIYQIPFLLTLNPIQLPYHSCFFWSYIFPISLALESWVIRNILMRWCPLLVVPISITTPRAIVGAGFVSICPVGLIKLEDFITFGLFFVWSSYELRSVTFKAHLFCLATHLRYSLSCLSFSSNCSYVRSSKGRGLVYLENSFSMLGRLNLVDFEMSKGHFGEMSGVIILSDVTIFMSCSNWTNLVEGAIAFFVYSHTKDENLLQKSWLCSNCVHTVKVASLYLCTNCLCLKLLLK